MGDGSGGETLPEIDNTIITIPSQGKVEMRNSSMIQRIERESERILCRRKFVKEDIENEQTREFSGRKREKEKEGVEKIIRGRKREKDMQKEKTFCIGTQKFSSCVVFYVPIFYVPTFIFQITMPSNYIIIRKDIKIKKCISKNPFPLAHRLTPKGE